VSSSNISYRNGLEEADWRGLGVSSGIVIGRVLRVHGGRQNIYRVTLDDSEVEREVRRFRAAVRLSKRQLQFVKTRAEKELGKEHAYIFDAHLLMLEDRKLLHEVEVYIKQEKANAEWALKVISDRLLAIYAQIKDDYLRERGSDIEDVVQRILVALNGQRAVSNRIFDNAVIVAEDLLPSIMAGLDFSHTRAIATDAGGWTSHTAIIARGIGLPAVVGLRDLYRNARTGDHIIVDATEGRVFLHPSTNTIEIYRNKAARLSANGAAAKEAVSGKLNTLDGIEIRLRTNIDLLVENEGLNVASACGIGLYRSEFLMSQRGTLPNEEEQFQAYLKVAELAKEQPAKIRLFDIGGDKISVAISENERNPALGLRAIRLSLTHDDILRTQIRAVFRASKYGNIEITLPMITDVADVRRAKRLIAEEKERLTASGEQINDLRIGAMIEVPSAVFTADKIAREVDFFSLGTNDLIQYTLAVDRGNDHVYHWFRTLHPAVLKSVHHTLEVADKEKIQAVVCGEMAGTPVYAVVLVGLGAKELSMSASSLNRVNKVLTKINRRDAKEVAEKCLECETADDVEELVRQEFTARWSNLFPPESLPPRN